MLPQHLQLKVLSLLDDGAFNKVVEGGAAGAGAPPVASGPYHIFSRLLQVTCWRHFRPHF